MFGSFRRNAAHGASLLLMGILLIGLMIGAPRPRASAQGVSTTSIGSFAQPPVPVAQKYVPWTSREGNGSSIKSFSMTPTQIEIVMGVIVGTILLANIRFRPRKPSF